MRDRLHFDSFDPGDRLRYAGQPLEMLTGGAGMYQAGGGGGAPQNANGAVLGATGTAVQPHHGVICLVVLAVLILFLLDRTGFRFAVTAGRR